MTNFQGFGSKGFQGLVDVGFQSFSLASVVGPDCLWCIQDDISKVFHQSGSFTSTIKTSLAIPLLENELEDISTDKTLNGDTDTVVDKTPERLYLFLGRFTTTLLNSLDISAIDERPLGISFDEVNTQTLWCGSGEEESLYLQSGRYTSTLRASLRIGDISSILSGISNRGDNTLWCTRIEFGTLFLQSGKFTSTIKTSISALILADPESLSSDQENTLIIDGNTGPVGDRLVLASGEFTTTIKSSLQIRDISREPVGIESVVFG